MEAGLDVHRRVHVLACKHAAYLFQWRAFCERQGRSFQDTLTDEDEAVLACACARRSTVSSRTHAAQPAQAFHHETEKSLCQFEADVASGTAAKHWPQRCLHPTQGMLALSAALRVANESTVGRARLFRWGPEHLKTR